MKRLVKEIFACNTQDFVGREVIIAMTFTAQVNFLLNELVIFWTCPEVAVLHFWSYVRGSISRSSSSRLSSIFSALNEQPSDKFMALSRPWVFTRSGDQVTGPLRPKTRRSRAFGMIISMIARSTGCISLLSVFRSHKIGLSFHSFVVNSK